MVRRIVGTWQTWIRGNHGAAQLARPVLFARQPVICVETGMIGYEDPGRVPTTREPQCRSHVALSWAGVDEMPEAVSGVVLDPGRRLRVGIAVRRPRRFAVDQDV